MPSSLHQGSGRQACRHCSQAFEITPADLAFYEKVSPVFNGKKELIPPPTLCYFCRMIRRLSYRNERFLYHRKCDLTQRQIISSFSTDKPFPVYDIDAWWSDQWDPMDYAQSSDVDTSFFTQFRSLRDAVPRLALQQQRPMENSAYCNCASRNKNCYLVFSTNLCEDCYYGSWVNNSKDCIDCAYIESCELCYDCVNCRDCSRVRSSLDCSNCSDSYFLRSCQGCRSCFGCSNQINQEYMVYNQKKSKEEFEEFLKNANVGMYSKMNDAYRRVQDALADFIVKEFHGTQLEFCSGDYLRQCKQCHTSFDCSNSEDLRYCMCIDEGKDCMDYSYWGKNAELLYECQASGYNVQNLLFCNLCWEGCSNLLYCDQVFASKDCFGCVGLRNKQFCIFNKQYSKEEYDTLVPQIIQCMRMTGEWGEFFPTHMSAYAYNETLAAEHEWLEESDVRKRGWPWKTAVESESQYMGPPAVIPDNICDASDDITKQILTCEITGKPYKIIPQELKFYREMNISIPRKCPDQRHKERMALRNPRKPWSRQCAKCQKDIQTTYAPERPEIVYCESCYLKTVY